MNRFYQSDYIDPPQAVAFITSAATCYGNHNQIDCSKGSDVYQDAKQRIETHLLAAADKAVKLRQNNPHHPVELILGAFGCGAFAPRGNPDEYRNMIAGIYKEILPKFNQLFNQVVFAVPTFGSNEESNPAVVNHKIFRKVLM